ncbi:MAG: AAA family ATPase [candidate division Zixibacteria bacterium]|nr:AAA family ATPase [candidate division Zixibacteria bacterium]
MSATVPTVVVICGPPCSGKTTISRGLKERPEFVAFSYFEMDELRLSFWPGSHTPQDRAKAYALMYELAAKAVHAGSPGVILDATFQPSQQRHAVRTLADALAAKMVVFECAVKPDVAVQRFCERIETHATTDLSPEKETHAATDLSPEKVWDLAQDYRYFKTANRLDTLDSSKGVDQLIETIVNLLRSPDSQFKSYEWIHYGNAPRDQDDFTEVQATKTLLKLTARSRKRASRLWTLRKFLFAFSLTAVGAAVAILVKELAAMLIPTLAPFGFEGDPTEWFQIWAVVALLASGLLLLYEQLFEKTDAKALQDVKKAGQTPRLSLRETSPSNVELYNRYYRRIDPGEMDRLMLKGVPLWFVVPPKETGFDVYTSKTDFKPIDAKLLQDRASRLGLDWFGYQKWRTKEKMDQYFDLYHEVGVRVLNIEAQDSSVNLRVCRGGFVSHVCTELSANLHIEGRFGFELRQVFEGSGWIQSDSKEPRKRINLADVSEASRTYEMLVGVHVALTTADGYLILQRRSDAVQSSAGGIASSGAGSAQWKDIEGKSGSLTKTALREIKEEIGWVPHPDDDLHAPFLGAAFNLKWGRNLNFYCYFHTNWTIQQISGGPSRWHRILGGLKGRPVGVTRAHDAWEVAHIIPMPISALHPDGTLDPRFTSIVGNARHARGLLYCLAQSKKFSALKSSINS